MQPHAPQWFFCLFVHLFVLGVYVCVCFFFPWFLTITERNTSSLDWDPRVKLFMKTNFSCHFCEWLCKELYGVALQWKIFVICRLSMNNIRKSCLSYSLLSLSWRLFIRNGIWIYLKAKNQYQLEKLNMSEVWTLLYVTISEDNRNDGNKGYMMSLFFFSITFVRECMCINSSWQVVLSYDNNCNMQTNFWIEISEMIFSKKISFMAKVILAEKFQHILFIVANWHMI